MHMRSESSSVNPPQQESSLYGPAVRPHLTLLVLWHAAPPIRSSLLTTTVGACHSRACNCSTVHLLPVTPTDFARAPAGDPNDLFLHTSPLRSCREGSDHDTLHLLTFKGVRAYLEAPFVRIRTPLHTPTRLRNLRTRPSHFRINLFEESGISICNVRGSALKS